MFVERPRPTDPSVGFCRIPTRSGPTDRPTAARSAAKIRVGPIDRPTRPRAARRKIDGRDRPTDRPGRAQRGAKFTVGTDRPTDPKQLRGKLHHDGQNDAMVNGRTGNCNGTVFQTQSMRCNQGYGTYAKSNVRMSAMFSTSLGYRYKAGIEWRGMRATQQSAAEVLRAHLESHPSVTRLNDLVGTLL